MMDNGNGIILHEWWIVQWAEFAFDQAKWRKRKRETPVNIEIRNWMKKTVELNANTSFQITNKMEKKEISYIRLSFVPSSCFTIHSDQPAITLSVTNHNSNWLKWKSDKFYRKIFCSICDSWFLISDVIQFFNG